MTEKSFKLSIGKKIFLGFSVLIFIFLGMALHSYSELEQISSLAENAVPLSSRINSLQEFAISLESLEKDMDKFFTINYKENQEEVDKDFKKMKSIIKSIKFNADSNSITRLQEMEQLLSEIQLNFNYLVDLDLNSSNSKMINEKRILVYDLIDSERQKHRELLLETTNKIQVNVLDQKMMISGLIKEFLILGISTLIFGVLLSFITSRSISRSIEKLRFATTEIGQGRFNINIPIQSNDEIGELACAFNTMTGELQKTTVSKEYVENILRSMFDMLIVTTPDGTIRTVNKALCDLLGYRSEEIEGQSMNKLIYDENPHSENSYFIELVKKGSIINIEKYYIAKDGRKIPVLLSMSNMCDDFGNKPGVVFVARDITQSKRTDKELTSSLSLLNATLESTADGILVVDRKGRINRWNQKFVDMWQIPPEVLSSQSDEQALNHVLHQLVNPEAFLAKVREL
jgi:PAS domain S-box-containing protein